MQMNIEDSVNLNDHPISEKSKDLYGVSDFSKCIANAFENIEKPVGITVALNGAWGAGKTSIINMVKETLKENNSEIIVTEFKCLWFRGEEALAVAFLKHLTCILGQSFSDKTKDLILFVDNIKTIVKHVVNLSTGGTFGSLIEDVVSDFTNLVQEKSLEDSFNSLSQQLRGYGKRFLIIIDDLDRLSTQEMLAVFRLLRTIGHLPNVMYLIAFDKKLAEDSVKKEYPVDGANFLDKIIQASFEIPLPSKLNLINVLLNKLGPFYHDDYEEDKHSRDILLGLVLPYMETPRHVARLINIISITWPSIRNEINFADFIAMETIRIYDPNLFSFIVKNKPYLFNTNQELPKDLSDDDRKKLDMLFCLSVNAELNVTLNAQRRICVSKYFDTYLKLSLNDEVIRKSEVDHFLSNLNDISEIKKILIQEKDTVYRSGSSKSIAYLFELLYNTDKLDKDTLEPFMEMLFEIYDDIDNSCKADECFSTAANAYFVYEGLIEKLFYQTTSEHESLNTCLKIMSNASVGWLTRYLSNVMRGNMPEDYVDALKLLTLQAIEKGIQNDKLIQNKNLTFVLGIWKSLVEKNTSDILNWTSSMLSKKENLFYFIQAFTIPVFTVQNHISTVSSRVSFLDESIFDREKFKESLLEAKEDPKTTTEERELIESFLSLWENTTKRDFYLNPN